MDVEQHPEVWKQFKLRVEPTIIVMDKGKETHRWKGPTEIETLKNVLKTRKQQGLKLRKKGDS